MLNLYN